MEFSIFTSCAVMFFKFIREANSSSPDTKSILYHQKRFAVWNRNRPFLCWCACFSEGSILYHLIRVINVYLCAFFSNSGSKMVLLIPKHSVWSSKMWQKFAVWKIEVLFFGWCAHVVIRNPCRNMTVFVIFPKVVFLIFVDIFHPVCVRLHYHFASEFLHIRSQ
jgi:hypothetical protein